MELSKVKEDLAGLKTQLQAKTKAARVADKAKEQLASNVASLENELETFKQDGQAIEKSLEKEKKKRKDLEKDKDRDLERWTRDRDRRLRDWDDEDDKWTRPGGKKAKATAEGQGAEAMIEAVIQRQLSATLGRLLPPGLLGQGPLQGQSHGQGPFQGQGYGQGQLQGQAQGQVYPPFHGQGQFLGVDHGQSQGQGQSQFQVQTQVQHHNQQLTLFKASCSLPHRSTCPLPCPCPRLPMDLHGPAQCQTLPQPCLPGRLLHRPQTRSLPTRVRARLLFGVPQQLQRPDLPTRGTLQQPRPKLWWTWR